ncbi:MULTISPECIES: 7-cyano-7-deazaguanine synthase QueC [Winogradskyella]|uniref:7-cyano-7-deazaguanine synthase QueC n=1 Tax=Winogradskyella TaxID=286104 RepID=UPI0015CA9ECF|nr:MULTISPECIES: 7-cyano-7-deazaguanine synthase QueC [Winogradskyella]QXP79816.1 7-cyano-7-deazaguanine synthase QueC [Winogradskyella sp. HaHa_3_26]
MEKNKVILLLSGGIDSTTLLAKLKEENKEVLAISYFYDQKHAIELEFAKENAEKYNVIEHKTIQLDSQLFSSSALVNSNKQLSTYKEGEKPEGQENAYVPYRNLVFLSMALSLAESYRINDIYVAFNKDDCVNFWDCTTAFLSQLNTISEQSKTEVHAPLINLTKKEVVQLAKKLDVDLNRTISCYQPFNDKECGSCLSCLVKQDAFNRIEIE